MEMNLQFSIDDLVAPPVSPSYFSSVEKTDVDVQSVKAAASGSDESDIEIFACHRQVPVKPQTTIDGREITTDLYGFTDSELPDFPWDDFESILQSTEEQADPLDRGAGPSEATRIGSPLLKQCGKLQPQVDNPLSPPSHERGPSYGPNVGDQLPQMQHPLPLISHIQAKSVRMASHYGQP